ncbi:hypothetical protein WJX73_002443 [Symbiochloris irregularis]|uniref:Protein kinase domain-containing protein n=1 Tax=Symbiochloris irregularis TaxID=706552 RepID=A0AAW1NXK9_9CHLO
MFNTGVLWHAVEADAQGHRRLAVVSPGKATVSERKIVAQPLFGNNTSNPYSFRVDAISLDGQALFWARAILKIGTTQGQVVTNGANTIVGYTTVTLQTNTYTGLFTFAGAECVAWTLNSTQNNSGLFVVDDAIWQHAAQEGYLVNTIDPTGREYGQVPDALCQLPTASSCSLNVGLDPSTAYQAVLWNYDYEEAEEFEVKFRTLDPGSAECANASPVQQPNGTDLYTLPKPYTDGQMAVETVQIFSSLQSNASSLLSANLTSQAALLVNNSFCVFYTMWPHNVQQSDFSKFSVGMVTSGQLRNAIYQQDPNQPNYSSSCTLETCNANAGTWTPEYGLAAEQVLLVLSYPSSIITSHYNLTIDVLVQAFGQDKCNELEQAGASNSSSTTLGTSNGSGASSATNAGAIAGGVVGGVVGLAAVAALALFLLYRRRKASDDSNEDKQLVRQDLHQHLARPLTASAANSSSPPSSSRVPNDSQTSARSHDPEAWSTAGSLAWLDTARSLTESPSGDISWAIDPATIRICTHPDGRLFKLGQGGFGAVYKAVQDDVRTVAIKVSQAGAQVGLSLSGERRVSRNFWAEIKHLADCRDANILTFYGAAVHDEDLWLVTEFCERGDLLRALNGKCEHIDSYLAWHRRGQYIALDVARGIHALHIRNIVHFDIKSPNILLTKDYTAKVADVGLARHLFSYSNVSDGGHARGTWSWQAPETILGQASSTPADIYSFGIVLHELMSGDPPLRGSMREIRVPEEAPQEAVQLMEDCLLIDPQARPKAKQIVERLQAMVDQSSWEIHYDPPNSPPLLPSTKCS